MLGATVRTGDRGKMGGFEGVVDGADVFRGTGPLVGVELRLTKGEKDGEVLGTALGKTVGADFGTETVGTMLGEALFSVRGIDEGIPVGFGNAAGGLTGADTGEVTAMGLVDGTKFGFDTIGALVTGSGGLINGAPTGTDGAMVTGG